MPAWIGDAVMTEPFIRKLVELFPYHALDAFASPWIVDICQSMGHFSAIHENNFAHGQLALKSRYQLAQNLCKISNNNYTHAYILPNSIKSALIPFFAKIPIRIGFHGESRYFLLNQRRKLQQEKKSLLVDRYYYLAEEKLPSSKIYPQLQINQQQQQQLITNYSLNQKKIIAICPGAEYGLAKRWPIENYANVITNLAQNNHQFILLGSKKDFQTAEQIIDLLEINTQEKCLNLCGKTKLSEAIDLLGLANLVICNDSGLMHITAALGRVIIAIFGSSSAQYTPPLVAPNYPQPIIMQSDLICAPCFQRTCRYQHYNCLKQTTADKVSLNALELLAN